MAFYSLSNLISKFLKRTALSPTEKLDICTDLGAIPLTQLSSGGNGGADDGQVPQYGLGGELYSTGNLSVVNGFGATAALMFDGDKLKLFNDKASANCSLIFPAPSTGVDWTLPTYSGEVVAKQVSGYIPETVIPHTTSILEVANETERLALTYAQARNKIVMESAEYWALKMYVLNDGETLPGNPAHWTYLGEAVTTSEGGEGPDDEAAAARYGNLGNLNATTGITVHDLDETNKTIGFANDTATAEPYMFIYNGTYSAKLNLGTLTGNRTISLPNTSGTLLVDTDSVTISTAQDISGSKEFTTNSGCSATWQITSTGNLLCDGPAEFNDQVETSATHQLDTDFSVVNKILGDHRYLTQYSSVNSDVGVTSSVTPVDSGAAIPLAVGVYEIELFVYSTHNSTGGLRVHTAFAAAGAMTLKSSQLEHGANGGTLVAFAAANEGYQNDFTRSGSADSFVKIRAIYDVTTAGTLKLQFAQSVSNGAASTIKAGSFIRAVPIQLV